MHNTLLMRTNTGSQDKYDSLNCDFMCEWLDALHVHDLWSDGQSALRKCGLLVSSECSNSAILNMICLKMCLKASFFFFYSIKKNSHDLSF